MALMTPFRRRRHVLIYLSLLVFGLYTFSSLWTQHHTGASWEPSGDADLSIAPHNLREEEDIPQPFNSKLPRVVYYLWCGVNPHFVFANYLSLQSVVRFLQPERIVFLHNKYPEIDMHMYNTWLDEFKDQYPYMELKQLNWVAVNHTCDSMQSMMEFVLGYLYDGGIFMGTNTVLTKPALHLWDEFFIKDMKDPRSGIIVSAPRGSSESLYKRRTSGSIECPFINPAQVNGSVPSICVTIALDLKLRNIWHVESPMGKLLNMLMYNKETTPVAKPHNTIVVPNIAHMLWLNGKAIDYVCYLSVLSLLYIVKVEKLYIHGNYEPAHEGYWAKLMEEESRVKFILRQKPDRMYDQRSVHPHTMSDVFRAEIMDKYGGIYSDVDAVWTRPISEELRKYEAVASFDWAHNYAYYPDYINLGVSIGAKGAPFWKHFLHSFKNLKDELFGFNGLLQPYKIYERHPDSLLIDPHLQVMCFRTECYPAWTKNWTKVDFKTETNAFHWTHPNPSEFLDRDTLVRSTGLWAEIGKYVLEKSGK